MVGCPLHIKSIVSKWKPKQTSGVDQASHCRLTRVFSLATLSTLVHPELMAMTGSSYSHCIFCAVKAEREEKRREED